MHLGVGFLYLRLSCHQLGTGGAQPGLGRLEIRLRGIVLGYGNVIGCLGSLGIATRQQGPLEQRPLPL